MNDPMITDADLAALEHQVCAALESGGVGGLRVLGYGEITLVLGWPPEAPRVACKRLPVFPGPERAAAYGATIVAYIAELVTRGVDVLTSEWRVIATDEGVAAYVVQPVLPRETLGPDLVRAGGARETDVLARIVSTIADTVDQRAGLDGQLSNWAVVDGRLRYFDVTTPMLNDDAGRPRLDVDLLARPFPAPARSIIKHAVAPRILAHFHQPRYVLVDMLGNLLKERLDPVVDAAIRLANQFAEPSIDRSEIERFYRSDARTWEVLLRLRRADRWWQRHVRHRTYPFLLPGSITR